MEYAQLHEEVCDAICNNSKIRYGLNKRYTLSPFTENDLGDKTHEISGQILLAYILGNDEMILDIMKKQCAAEIDSLIDLIGR